MTTFNVRPGAATARDDDRPIARVAVLTKRWYTVAEVATMLGFGLSKTKMLIATGQLRSLKDGKHRRVLPEWVDEYVERRAKEWLP
ncbi:MAG TPA: excisionase family DNA-binding protein [Mycobacterium sp.]|nr:excisionase family DNA-binding protein [Mycobacterium sp.]